MEAVFKKYQKKQQKKIDQPPKNHESFNSKLTESAPSPTVFQKIDCVNVRDCQKYCVFEIVL